MYIWLETHTNTKNSFVEESLDFQFNEKFLEKVGLISLSEKNKSEILKKAQDEFEVLIGEKLEKNIGQSV